MNAFIQYLEICLKIVNNENMNAFIQYLEICLKIVNNENMNAFIQYLEICLKIVNNENKEIYICGDFNIDLLKIESVSLYQEYYDLLCSFGLLPHIIQPTRIVENQTPSVIDNIFSNNLNDDITAGNLLIAFRNIFHNSFQ